jgi:hypothetical protein
MDATLLESLLHKEESETLDFKREQYRFSQASDDDKSELLKDVLAFANAWRQSDAYILIGVEEVKAGRSIVRGVQQHLINEHLQQFVTSKTNRPVLFKYAPVAFEGVEIGILTIPRQDRPSFLRQPYGKLKSLTVYIRRSATTDIASPDEIYSMGQPAMSERLALGPQKWINKSYIVGKTITAGELAAGLFALFVVAVWRFPATSNGVLFFLQLIVEVALGLGALIGVQVFAHGVAAIPNTRIGIIRDINRHIFIGHLGGEGSLCPRCKGNLHFKLAEMPILICARNLQHRWPFDFTSVED